MSKFKNTQDKRSSKIRPFPAPFDAEKIRELGGETSTDGDFIVCEGQRYRRGLLYKIFTLNSVTDENIHPTLEELKYFQDKGTTDPDFIKECMILLPFFICQFSGSYTHQGESECFHGWRCC